MTSDSTSGIPASASAAESQATAPAAARREGSRSKTRAPAAGAGKGFPGLAKADQGNRARHGRRLARGSCARKSNEAPGHRKVRITKVSRPSERWCQIAAHFAQQVQEICCVGVGRQPGRVVMPMVRAIGPAAAAQRALPPRVRPRPDRARAGSASRCEQELADRHHRTAFDRHRRRVATGVPEHPLPEAPRAGFRGPAASTDRPASPARVARAQQRMSGAHHQRRAIVEQRFLHNSSAVTSSRSAPSSRSISPSRKRTGQFGVAAFGDRRARPPDGGAMNRVIAAGNQRARQRHRADRDPAPGLALQAATSASPARSSAMASPKPRAGARPPGSAPDCARAVRAATGAAPSTDRPPRGGARLRDPLACGRG